MEASFTIKGRTKQADPAALAGLYNRGEERAREEGGALISSQSLVTQQNQSEPNGYLGKRHDFGPINFMFVFRHHYLINYEFRVHCLRRMH